MKTGISNLTELDALKDHPTSTRLNDLFKTVIKTEDKPAKKTEAKPMATSALKDQELSLVDEELDIGLASDGAPASTPVDDGLELSLDSDESLDLSTEGTSVTSAISTEQYGDLSLEGEDLGFSLNEDNSEDKSATTVLESIPEAPGDDLALSLDDELSLSEEPINLSDTSTRVLSVEEKLDLSEDSSGDDAGLSLADDDLNEGLSLDFSAEEEKPLKESTQSDFSDDAKKKLREIDEILTEDASRIIVKQDLGPKKELASKDVNEPLVAADIDLGGIDFGIGAEEEEIPEVEEPVKEEKKKTKKKEGTSTDATRVLGSELREITGAYSGEMERMQATISNLRADRSELLARIQKLEDDRVIQSRSNLTMRAELDEKKIELTIIRKKLNEEIGELRDRMKLYDEKKLIWEEKIRFLQTELDKSSQKNKIDVKKVQMRERELEQRLELLKSDAETQIRNRDHKILELKRKIDAMEFDMESISQQEKKSIESRYELEDKLDKAIKTLRTAINVLEDESERSTALDALKKNLDV